jgi:ATP-dependent RNA helicase DDX24/MAK5
LFLYYFLLRYPGRTLVFVNSIDAVRRIVPILQSLHIEAHALHSQKVQKQRLQSLERFRSSPTAIMVATDIAARGLDIPAVKHVVHYHLPRTADTYVHRSGRTARGTEEGVSLLLCSPVEQRGLRALLVKLGKAKRVERVLEAFPVDRVLISRLKPRINLVQKVVNAEIEVQKRGHQEKWMSEAAGDLGVDEEELTRVINSKGYHN